MMLESQQSYSKDDLNNIFHEKFLNNKENEIKEQLLDIIFSSVNVGISVINEEGKYEIVNCAYCDILGYTKEELIGETFTVILPKKEWKNALAIHKAFVENGEIKRKNWKVIRKNGEILDVITKASILNGEDDKRYRVTILVDITKEKYVHEKLNLITQVLNNTAEGIIFTSEDPTEIIYINEAFSKITGYTSEEIMSEKSNILVDGIDGEDFYYNMWEQVKKEGIWQGEIRGQRKNKKEYSALYIVTAIKDPQNENVTNYAGIINEKADTRKYEERIKYLSTYDSITNLPKRHVFENTLYEIVNNKEEYEGRKVAVLMVDLDMFKNINDTYGFAVGNKLLRAVGSRIKYILEEDNFSAYLGEDHFGVLLTDIENADNAANIANKINDSLTRHFIIEDNEINITCSIGISIYPDETESIQDLISHAENAISEAKRHNRNCVKFYTQELNNKLSRRQRIETDLKNCTKKNELFLVYQPQLDLSTGKMVGVEALLRWKHPTLGLIPPDEFISIAEETGSIIPIGEWVFKTACEQAKTWQDIGIPSFKVAVNISYIQLKQDNICGVIKNIIEKTGVGQDTMELELTESSMMQDIEKSINVFNQLKHIGVKISIDDFGTGYSSLSYLRKIPINKLKIDRSFITDLGNDFESSVITKTIIDMARNLRFRVIAEGAETKAHIDYLKENGCHEVQGYYFSKPLLPGDLEKFATKL